MSYDDLFEEMAVPALEEHLADPEGFTQYPGGDVGNPVTATDAIFIEESPKRKLLQDSVERTAELQVNGDLAVDSRDRWVRLKDSTAWETIAIGEIDGNWRTIEIRRDQHELPDGEYTDVL